MSNLITIGQIMVSRTIPLDRNVRFRIPNGNLMSIKIPSDAHYGQILNVLMSPKNNYKCKPKIKSLSTKYSIKTTTIDIAHSLYRHHLTIRKDTREHRMLSFRHKLDELTRDKNPEMIKHTNSILNGALLLIILRNRNTK